jgi:hypothetical protein
MIYKVWFLSPDTNPPNLFFEKPFKAADPAALFFCITVISLI